MRNTLITLLRLVGLLLLPAMAHAAPVFHYTYVSGVLGAHQLDHPDPAFVSQRFTIDLWTPAALSLGLMEFEGVRARLEVPGALRVSVPLPECTPASAPFEACRRDDGWPVETRSYVSLLVDAFDVRGLPLAFTLSAGVGSTFEGEHSESIGSYTEATAGDAIDAITSMRGRFDFRMHAFNIEERGQWSLAMTEVPLPGTLALALAGLAGLGLRRGR